MNNSLYPADIGILIEKQLEKKRLKKESKLWLLNRMRGVFYTNYVGTYGSFLKPGEINIFVSTPCSKRLPGGRYCDLIEGRAKEISVIGCMKCKDRITDNTLSEVIKEDEYAIE